MPRRFQFSLRALLLGTTVVCVLFGWIAGTAKQRGAAIDAIVKSDSVVAYGDDVFLFKDENANHFWLDVKRVPVKISIGDGVKLDAALGERLERVAPIELLDISDVHDDELRYLTRLNKGCTVILFSSDKLSKKAMTKLKQQLPGVEVKNLLN